METNIKKSNTITNIDRDDWLDEKGMLHTKIVKEIITGPMTNGPESKYGHLNQMRPKLIMKRMNLPQLNFPYINQMPQQQQPNQIPQMPHQMDFGKLMEMGKKFLDASGINLQEVLGGLTGKMETPSGEEYEPDEKYNSYVQSEAVEAKAKEELDRIMAPETNPLKDQKEVKTKWQTKTKKLQKNKQTQKKLKQKKIIKKK